MVIFEISKWFARDTLSLTLTEYLITTNVVNSEHGSNRHPSNFTETFFDSLCERRIGNKLSSTRVHRYAFRQSPQIKATTPRQCYWTNTEYVLNIGTKSVFIAIRTRFLWRIKREIIAQCLKMRFYFLIIWPFRHIMCSITLQINK